MGKELSSATHVAETADGGLSPKGMIKQPRLVASPAAAAAPFAPFGRAARGMLPLRGRCREAIPLAGPSHNE